ncbi:hypothetical protein A7P54_03680 [Acinetobacter sp. Ac_3412]|uniref:hypothetical protein n=1 Tax=Acinetobacter sp. Ac_3412 TaxID=1848935 RepID=UPI00148F9A0A|nr:hypothetical protein [Acinetobacter sp. Ac_3412]NNP75519.1 hypothetical protein [Acinetobacter sp. Ac_3412]
MTEDEQIKLLLDFSNPISEAISLLNDGGKDGKIYSNQAIMLLLIFFDQLGWLSSPKDFSDGGDFKKWLNTYMEFSGLNCSAEDLWVARCGLLHMGLPYNKQFNDNKNYQIAWYSDLFFTEDQRKLEESKYAKPTKLVNTNSLIINFQKALFKFFKDVLNNKELNAVVMSKLKKRPIHYQF